MPSPNERFHASGGAISSDTEQVTSSFALVRALPIPPACRQAAGRYGQVGGQCTDTNYFRSCTRHEFRGKKMGIFIGWIILSFVMGIVGSGRTIGFWLAFLYSLLFSPLVGFILVLFSKDKETEEYEAKILKVQQNQQKTLERLSGNKEIKPISIADELEKLKRLRDDNIISENEFKNLKNKIINSETNELNTFSVYNEPQNVSKCKYNLKKIFDNSSFFGPLIRYLVEFEDGQKGEIFYEEESNRTYFEQKYSKWKTYRHYYENDNYCINSLYHFLKTGEILKDGFIATHS